MKTQVAIGISLAWMHPWGELLALLLNKPVAVCRLSNPYPTPRGSKLATIPGGYWFWCSLRLTVMRSCFNSCVCPLDELWMKQFRYE